MASIFGEIISVLCKTREETNTQVQKVCLIFKFLHIFSAPSHALVNVIQGWKLVPEILIWYWLTGEWHVLPSDILRVKWCHFVAFYNIGMLCLVSQFSLTLARKWLKISHGRNSNVSDLLQVFVFLPPGPTQTVACLRHCQQGQRSPLLL